LTQAIGLYPIHGISVLMAVDETQKMLEGRAFCSIADTESHNNGIDAPTTTSMG
jgi:hypothetical protein